MALLNVRILTVANSTQAVTDTLTVGAIAPFTVVTSALPVSIPGVVTLTAGTVAVVNGSAAVVGSGTTFGATLTAGCTVQFASQPGGLYLVLSITSDTTLTLMTAYTGTSNVSTGLYLQYINISSGTPVGFQFVVNYLTGVVTFPATAAGLTFSINYNSTFYTPTVGALSADIELWGGGGAGGNALGATPLNYSVGSGGGAGSYAKYFFPSLGAGPYGISIGTGGGTPILGASFNGGNTSINTGSSIITAYGGRQGNTIQVGASVPEISLGGLGGVISTNGTYNSAGDAGEEGLILSLNYIMGGAGGSTSLGGAGAALGITGTGSGNNATPNTGSGGGGAINTNLTTLTLGGWGSPGVIIISEYDTDSGNLVGDVTSNLNVTTLVNIPAISGALLTNLTAANISAGTAPISITGNAATATLAATVTTNADLTGPVTSVGNATTIVGPLPALSGAALTNINPANISAGTAGINITGNASTVTTNADLTGGVTSVGNVATVITNANLTGDVTSVGNVTTLVNIPALSGFALTHLTAANIDPGTAPINISGTAATVTTIPNLTGDVTSVGNLTTVVALGTTGPSVTVDTASPPTTGQVLTATSATAADWQTPSAGGITQLTGGVTAGPGSGSQIATVVTNANLTGDVTSVGNATHLVALGTTGTSVTVNTAAPPTTGQVLTATSATAADWQTPSSGSFPFGSFYALMPGDNAATVGLGVAVQFPQNGPASGITRFSATQITLPNTGIYEVSWQVSFDEAGQLVLCINGLEQLPTTAGRAAPTSLNTNTVMISASAADLLSIQNPAGSAAALTITPKAGGNLSASAWLTIKQIQ